MVYDMLASADRGVRELRRPCAVMKSRYKCSQVDQQGATTKTVKATASTAPSKPDPSVKLQYQRGATDNGNWTMTCLSPRASLTVRLPAKKLLDFPGMLGCGVQTLQATLPQTSCCTPLLLFLILPSRFCSLPEHTCYL